MAETSWYRRVWRWFWRQSRKEKLDVLTKLAGIGIGLIAIASLILSIKGCRNAEGANRIAEKANRTAADALETSQHQFIQLNRPYVILKPARYKNDRYWKLLRRDKSLVIELQYEVKNVGNVAAKHISLPDKVLTGPGMKLSKEAQVQLKKMGKMTLGPGDNYFVEVRTEIEYADPNSIDKNIELLTSVQSTGVVFQLSVEYANELDKSQTYRTFVMNRVFQDTVQLIKSEMLILSEEAAQSEKSNKPIQ